MGYEPGTKECLAYIHCKGQIEKMLVMLKNHDKTDQICLELENIYRQIESLHDQIYFQKRKDRIN